MHDVDAHGLMRNRKPLPVGGMIRRNVKTCPTHTGREVLERRIDMSAETLQIIKTGVERMLTKQHEQEARLTGIEGYIKERKGTGLGLLLPGASQGKRKVDIVKVALAQTLMKEGRKDAWDLVGGTYEKDVVEQATRKAIDSGTAGSGGGFVIPSEYLSEEFIETLRANSVLFRAGATELRDLTGKPVRIPRQIASGSVYWIGENSTINLSDPSFGAVDLTPKTMAMRNQYSRLMDILANPKALDLIQRDMAKAAALELDRAGLRGSGTSNQPTGIVNVSGIGSYAIGTNGGSLSVDDLYGMIGVLEDANAMSGKVALITHPKALRKLKKQRIAQFSGDTGGEYVVQPLLTDDALSKAIGLPCLTTTQIPTNLTKGTSTDCSEVYLANWEELLVGMWGGIEILATNVGGNAWAQNAIEVRLVQNVDFQVRHTQSFVVCADARTA